MTASLRGTATAAATLGVIIVAALTAVATLGAALPWPLTLAEHFRVQYLAGALVGAGLALALRRPRLVDAALIAALVNAIAVVPHLRPRPAPAAYDAAVVRALVLNVHTSNRRHDSVRALIDDLHPDLIVLVEVNRRWLDALAPSLTAYAGRLEAPQDDNFGVAVYHRRPLLGATATRLGGPVPSIVARVDADGAGAALTVIATHPLPPARALTDGAQRDQLDAIAALVARTPGPVLVAGDLNATPWSAPFERLVAGTGLRDSRDGFGLGASFPSDLAVVRIPIDHALVSPEVGVLERRVERDVGSDHLPVYVELAVPRAGSFTARSRTRTPPSGTP
jgi:endonuclease/exonuclease/phosphatase (EEP) superfamily protein YafD